MCNAWNHPPDCTCGWGGDGHLGRNYYGNNTGHVPAPPPAIRASWEFASDDICLPTSCPICGGEVFFVRHNNGCVWLDDLGFPWPKHGCFADSVTIRLSEAFEDHEERIFPPTFGIIVEAEERPGGESIRLVIKCSDGATINSVFKAKWNPNEIIGNIVAVERGEQNAMTISRIFPEEDEQEDKKKFPWERFLYFSGARGYEVWRENGTQIDKSGSSIGSFSGRFFFTLSPSKQLLLVQREASYKWGRVAEIATIKFSKDKKKLLVEIDGRISDFSWRKSCTGLIEGNKWVFIGHIKSDSSQIFMRLTVNEISPSEFSWSLERSTDQEGWVVAEKSLATKLKG